MLNEHRAMRWLSIFVVVGLAGGCGTRANPESCLDGLCTDQAFPFCDADGALEGEPGKCIAVSCTPTEVVACRGDQAVTCNAAGNDFDLVQCPLGCDAANGGCQRCATDSDCSSSAPVCDPAERTCRACRADAECASQICDVDAGTCVAESQIVYAAPGGATSGSCSLSAPCSLQAAAAVAQGNPSRSTLRALPGLYSTDETLMITGLVTAVGTGARVPSFFVGEGGNASMRGFEFTGAGGTSTRCEGTATTASLILQDVTLTSTSQFSVFLCDLTMRRVRVNTFMQASTQMTLDADRCDFRGGGILLRGTKTKARVTNSIFVNGGVAIAVIDQAPSRSEFAFAFNTFVKPTDIALTGPILECGSGGTTGANFIALFENNIMLGTDADVVLGTRCTLNHNILFPQVAGVASTNLVMDPKLVNAASGDFHLQADSPAIDTAQTSTALNPDHDFEGAARPQGGQHDIGAFERTP